MILQFWFNVQLNNLLFFFYTFVLYFVNPTKHWDKGTHLDFTEYIWIKESKYSTPIDKILIGRYLMFLY